jgi:hypothetical protein
LTVETELRRTGTDAFFVVRTDRPELAAALAELAYGERDGEFLRRFPPDAPGLAVAFARFERHVDELLAQTARQRPVPWEDALAEVATRLDAAGVGWFVVGSAALAVRGVDVQPRDVDLVVSESERTAAALADALIEPPLEDREGGWIAAWFGRAFLGARVEWVADVYAGDKAETEFAATAGERVERLRWNGRELQLAPLDIQLAVSRRRGLEDRVRAIQEFQAAAALR